MTKNKRSQVTVQHTVDTIQNLSRYNNCTKLKLLYITLNIHSLLKLDKTFKDNPLSLTLRLASNLNNITPPLAQIIASGIFTLSTVTHSLFIYGDKEDSYPWYLMHKCPLLGVQMFLSPLIFLLLEGFVFFYTSCCGTLVSFGLLPYPWLLLLKLLSYQG